jgi:hypothetical protein
MKSPWATDKIIEQCSLIANSYSSWTKKELLTSDLDHRETAFFMYHAPFAIVSHGIQADPIFNFANLKAQELWKLDWESFTEMPSRLSAEAISVEERQRALDEASKNGFISSYNGIRISSKGDRFRIKDAVLWNLIDDNGIFCGQAVMFYQWEFL